jgi:hypothetical protein
MQAALLAPATLQLQMRGAAAAGGGGIIIWCL